MTTETDENTTGSAEQRYLLYIWGSVEPELRGPYATDEERLAATRTLAADGGGDEHAIFRLDASGPVEVTSFSGREIEV
jgi:hypothetical protein